MLALGMTSCQKSEEVTGTGEATVTISATLPAGMGATRAYGDGETVDRCIMEVYLDGKLYGERQTVSVSGLQATFSARLVSGKSYDLVFWADKAGANQGDLHYDTSAFPEVRFTGDYAGNDETRDAFFGTAVVKADQSKAVTVELKRPFGQLNIATLDMADVPADMQPTEVSIAFESVPTGINLLTGELTEARTAVSYSVPAALVNAENGDLSVDYLFAPKTEGEQYLANFTMSFLKGGAEVASDYTFSSIPVQRNYRTNVSGYLLTKKADITVEVKPAFDGDLNQNEVEVSASGLQALLDALDVNEVCDYSITVADALSAGSYDLPALADGVTLSLNLAGASDEVTFAGEEFAGLFELSSTAADPVAVNIDLPKGGAALNEGSWEVASVSTSPMALTVNDGAVVGSIRVAAGNVVINEGAEVASVSRTEENSDAETVVTLFDGAEAPEISDAKISTQTGVSGQIVIDGQSFATIRDAVMAASEGDVIEIAEGSYDLGAPGQPDVNGPDGYYLKIDKGITLKGTGNVEISTSHDANTGSWSLQNLVTVRAENVTIEGITFIANYNSYFEGPNKTIEVFANEGNNFTLRNCKLVGGVNAKNAGCLYLGTDTGSGQTATIEGCTFVNSAITVRVNTTAQITDCTFDGIRELDGWNCSVASRGKAVIESSEFINCTAEEGKEPVVANGNGYVNLVDNTFPTTDGVYWAMRDNGLVLFNGAYSFSGGAGSYENPYQLSTPEDILMIGKLYTAGLYDDIYSASFKMTNDIDISATPIRNLGVMGFLFDGDGHTLKVNLTSDSAVGAGSAGYVGLFAGFNGKGNTYIYEATGSELNDPKAYEVNGKKYIIKGGCIRDLVIEGTVKSSVGGQVAPLVAGTCTGYIINVTNNASIEASNGANFVAGIVSYIKGTGLMFDCTNNGTITVSGGDNARPVGGITAQCYGGSSCNGTYPDILAPYSASVHHCTNNGDIITDTYDVGGIVGQTHGYGNTRCITDCVNTGDISGTRNVGGIIGRHTGTGGQLYLAGNTNSGTITADSDSGSIYGKNEGALIEGSQAQN